LIDLILLAAPVQPTVPRYGYVGAGQVVIVGASLVIDYSPNNSLSHTGAGVLPFPSVFNNPSVGSCGNEYWSHYRHRCCLEPDHPRYSSRLRFRQSFFLFVPATEGQSAATIGDVWLALKLKILLQLPTGFFLQLSRL